MQVARQRSLLICTCVALVDRLCVVVVFFFSSSGIQASGWEESVVTSNGSGVPIRPTAGLPL